MTVDPVRYGIVGLGRAGWGIHLARDGYLGEREDARIVAVADPLAQRRDEAIERFGCKAYDRLEDMLKQDDIEVAVIATLSVSHAPDTIKALRAAKHVVVEKPMATKLDDADEMIAVAEETGRQLFVHQNYRYNPVFTHLRQVIDSGQIGDVYHIRNYIGGFSRRNDWQCLARNGGGVLNNTCPHFVDMILQLLDAPVVDVMGDLQQIAAAGDVEDHVKAFIRAANGRTADMEITSAQDVACAQPRWVLCGSCGTLTCSGDESVIRWYDPQEAGPIEVIEGAAANREYGNEDKLPWQEQTVSAQGPDIGAFYDNVVGVLRRGEPMYITPQSVREVMRVIAEIRKGTKFE